MKSTNFVVCNSGLKVYTKIEDFKGVKNPVLTVGTFDGVHAGHQAILRKINEIARKNNGESVLLTFFPHPRMVLFSGGNERLLLNTLKEKTDLLEQFGLDHLIILPFSKDFSRITPTEYVRDLLVRDIGVKTLVIGYDHRFGRNREGDYSLLEELAPVYGFNLEEISAQEVNDIKVSSTKVRDAILEGDIKTANEYSKHNFTLTGMVTKGDGIGRTIGFPTANIEVPEEHKIIPGIGVYAVYVYVNGDKHKGMLNIGQRPTIKGGTDRVSIEVNIFNFEEVLYNKIVKVEFIERLRDEKGFGDLEQLQKQLLKDKEQSLKLLVNN